MNCTDIVGDTHSDGYCLCPNHATKLVWSEKKKEFVTILMKDAGNESGRVQPVFACEETDMDLVCDVCLSEAIDAGTDTREAIILEDEEEVCCVCGKPAEGKEDDVCDCVCPECGEDTFDDQTLSDHGMCYDCFQKWRSGKLNTEDEEE